MRGANPYPPHLARPHAPRPYAYVASTPSYTIAPPDPPPARNNSPRRPCTYLGLAHSPQQPCSTKRRDTRHRGANGTAHTKQKDSPTTCRGHTSSTLASSIPWRSAHPTRERRNTNRWSLSTPIPSPHSLPCFGIHGTRPPVGTPDTRSRSPPCARTPEAYQLAARNPWCGTRFLNRRPAPKKKIALSGPLFAPWHRRGPPPEKHEVSHGRPPGLPRNARREGHGNPIRLANPPDGRRHAPPEPTCL